MPPKSGCWRYWILWRERFLQQSPLTFHLESGNYGSETFHFPRLAASVWSSSRCIYRSEAQPGAQKQKRSSCGCEHAYRYKKTDSQCFHPSCSLFARSSSWCSKRRGAVWSLAHQIYGWGRGHSSTFCSCLQSPRPDSAWEPLWRRLFCAAKQPSGSLLWAALGIPASSSYSAFHLGAPLH